MNLYSFADLLGDWNAAFAFIIILLAILGVMRNRKTNHIKVTHSKFLLPSGIVSLLIMGSGIFFIPIQSIGNLVYIIDYYDGTIPIPPGVNAHITIVDIVGAASQIVVLFLFLGIMLIPAIVRNHNDHRKRISKMSHKHY
jgi:hypothetical protein